MTTPDVVTFLLLGLAAWSIFHLLAHDDILDRPRRKILRLGQEWEKDGDPVPENYRVKWAQFLTCPYCAGFWIWGGWLALWWIVPGFALPLAVIFGGRALVVGAQKLFGKSEDKAPSPDAQEIADSIADLAWATRKAAQQKTVVRTRS